MKEWKLTAEWDGEGLRELTPSELREYRRAFNEDEQATVAIVSDVSVTNERCRELAAQPQLDVADWCELMGIGSGRHESYQIDGEGVRFRCWSESNITDWPILQYQIDMRRENKTLPLNFPCTPRRLVEFVDAAPGVHCFSVPDAFRDEVERLARAALAKVRHVEAESATSAVEGVTVAPVAVEAPPSSALPARIDAECESATPAAVPLMAPVADPATELVELICPDALPATSAVASPVLEAESAALGGAGSEEPQSGQVQVATKALMVRATEIANVLDAADERADPPTIDESKPAGRERFDDIQIEIDDVIRQGVRATPAGVMAALKARAGRADSCISETFENGVIWIRGSSGALERLTTTTLKSRLHRRRSR